MNKNYILGTIAVVVIVAGLFFILFSDNSSKSPTSETLGTSVKSTTSDTDTATQSAMKTLPKPEMIIDTKKTYEAVLHTTAGDITIAFDTKNSPVTSNNFIYLAKNNFYDNTIFHRVLEGFMIQGGDPEGTGRGGPGYQFNDEYLQGKYTRGTVAMANAGPNTNGSQFFIMHKDYDLPNQYVIFAHVTSGLDTLDKIATAPVTIAFGGEQSKPVNPVKVTSVEVIEK